MSTNHSATPVWLSDDGTGCTNHSDPPTHRRPDLTVPRAATRDHITSQYKGSMMFSVLRRAVALAAPLLIASNVAVASEDAVMVVNGGNIEQAIKDNEHLVVEFYAPCEWPRVCSCLHTFRLCVWVGACVSVGGIVWCECVHPGLCAQALYTFRMVLFFGGPNVSTLPRSPNGYSVTCSATFAPQVK